MNSLQMSFVCRKVAIFAILALVLALTLNDLSNIPTFHQSASNLITTASEAYFMVFFYYIC